MDNLIRRLEALHRQLRAAPGEAGYDPRIVEAIANCLRDLHAIAAQSTEASADPRLRLVESGFALHQVLH